ncbi:MAG: alpha/beta hydrolase [Chthoniobacterales bacterium]
MSTETHQSFLDVPYAKYGDRELVLDVFLPAKPEGPLPVILVVAGGGWRSGRKEGTPARYTKRGFAVVGICYRGSKEVIAPGNVHDCKAAVRWIRANAATYGFDTSRIGVFGGSAGGQLAGLLGMTAGVKELEGEGGNPEFDSSVHAVCDVCGPSDITRIGIPKYKEGYPSLYEMTAEYLGGPVEENMNLARLVSPLNYIDSAKNIPPYIFIHGDSDEAVPVDESWVFFEALRERGVNVQLRILNGVKHAIPWDEEDNTIQSFFERIFMKKGEEPSLADDAILRPTK